MTADTKNDALVSLSLANLLFAASWRELLYPATFDYHVQNGPAWIDYAGALIVVLASATLIFALIRGAAQLSGKIAGTARITSILFLTLVAGNAVRLQFVEKTPEFVTYLMIPAIVLGSLVLLATRYRETLVVVSRTLALVLAPFAIITIGQSLFGLINSDRNRETGVAIESQLASIPDRKRGKIASRVVWIIFDEFDYRVAFDLKPVPMSEFERLRSESVFATQALSPADDTLESIPSLLVGRNVAKAEPIGREDLQLRFADCTSSTLGTSPSAFSDVRDLEGNAAALGWYHPYCRLFADELSACSWDGEDFSKHESLPAAVSSHLPLLYRSLELIPDREAVKMSEGFAKVSNFEFKGSEKERATAESRYLRKLEESKLIAADPRIDLAFIHLPIPHAPVQFDMKTGRFTAERQDYANNLALIDQYLGAVRQAMEESGLWESTVLIVSSDHGWRIKRWKDAQDWHKLALTEGDRQLTGLITDPRVPFILKPSGRNAGVDIDRRFNTVITRQLIGGALAGRLRSAADFINEIETQATNDLNKN